MQWDSDPPLLHSGVAPWVSARLRGSAGRSACRHTCRADPPTGIAVAGALTAYARMEPSPCVPACLLGQACVCSCVCCSAPGKRHVVTWHGATTPLAFLGELGQSLGFYLDRVSVLSQGRIVILLLKACSESSCALEQALFQVQCNMLGCCAISQCPIRVRMAGRNQVWALLLLWQWENPNSPFTLYLSLSLPLALEFCLFPLFYRLKTGVLCCYGGLVSFIEKICLAVTLLIHWIILPDSSVCWFQWTMVLVLPNGSNSYSYFCGAPFIFTTILTPVIKRQCKCF